MRNIQLIAKREYLEQIRGRAFRMTTIGLPAIFALLILVGYLSSKGLGSNKHLAVAAPDAALANSIRAQLLGDKDTKATVDVVAPASESDRAALMSQVKNKTIDGVLWIDTPAGSAPTATYFSEASGDFITSSRLKDALKFLFERTAFCL